MEPKGNYPSWARVARLLKVLESELVKRKLRRNDMEGIPRAYLEERMECLSITRDWETFIDILGLSLYGLILLPCSDDYVDYAAIDALSDCREKDKNPMLAVLANTYYILNNNREGKGRRLTCCLHALYLWFTTHMFTSKCRTLCLIEDHKWCLMKTLTDQDASKS
ncbi:hypothetical protein CR513_14705, partial [Mucuna pruriens]